MRFLLKASIPVETGNALAKEGRLGEVIESILADLEPEAAYFMDDNGMRTALVVFTMEDSSQIPAVAEPWFLALKARVEIHPAMNRQELERSARHIEQAVKKYA